MPEQTPYGAPLARSAHPGAGKAGDPERYRTIFDTLAVTIFEHDMRDVKRALDALRATGVTDVRRYVAEHPAYVHELRGLLKITDINRTGLMLFGVERKEDFFQNLSDFLSESDDSFFDCLVAIDEEHPTFTSEVRLTTSSGRVVPAIVSVLFPPGHGFWPVYASLLDMTDRDRLRAEVERTRSDLERAQRAASLGELTASIAHEVKQPLAAILGSLQAGQRWLAREPADLDELRSSLSDAVAAAKQAAKVVNRVRKLLSDVSPVKRPTPVDATILDAIKFLRREAEVRSTRIDLDLRAGDREVLGDRVLLTQVLVNLITNSFQAMETVTGGKGSVSVASSIKGDEVVIDVADTGPGFGEDRSRVFQAFHTTRRDGMGLGLAISRFTVESQGGLIKVVSKPSGDGACVRIVLPVLPVS